jgi:hypothetical protein
MSQNAAFIEKEIPRIITIPTEAMDGSTATDWTTHIFNPTPTPTSPRPRSFTPVNDTHDCFRTPTNQTIHISYESLGLTTTKMRPMRDVLSAMEDDGAWDCQVYRPNLAFRLLVFLYGKGYYDDLSPQKRIYRIQQCITRDGENQKRLSEIAFSDQSDRILAAQNGFDCYFYMASTARMLFDRATAKGGFPVEAYYRIQASRKGYIVAVCMWLTVKLQRDYPNRKQLLIDAGYIGRHHVIDTREGLEMRVIEDKGDNAFDLCQNIIGDVKTFDKVNCHFCQRDDKKYQDKQRTRLDDFLDEGDLGLVSQFSVCENFHEKSNPKHAPKTFGYWKFDGDSIDCEGEFVTMEEDGNGSTERERLRKMWEEQLHQMQETKQDHKTKMKDVIAMSPRNETKQDHKTKMKEVIAMSPRNDNEFEDDVAVEEKNASGASMAESESFSEGKHAMVMLGFCTEVVAGEDKRFYVLWNWWATMPLVLVSFEYLVACRCQVFFLTRKLPADICEKAQCSSEALACECAFPDHEENTWFSQFGC